MKQTKQSLNKNLFSTAICKIETSTLSEKKYATEIEGNNGLKKIFNRNNCPTPEDVQYERKLKHLLENNVHKAKTNHSAGNINSRRSIAMLHEDNDPNIQGYQPENGDFGYRGDIPMVTVLDDGSILKALNNLIQGVNQLQGTVNQQHQLIDQLRRTLEECDVCRPRPEPVLRPNCATHLPNCSPGVQCHDTPDGPRCGTCPRGYIGDGYTCRPGKMCADIPCYPGVQCQDTVEGARCGPCPSGFDGNGEQCRRRSSCDYNPCHPMSVEIENSIVEDVPPCKPQTTLEIIISTLIGYLKKGENNEDYSSLKNLLQIDGDEIKKIWEFLQFSLKDDIKNVQNNLPAKDSLHNICTNSHTELTLASRLKILNKGCYPRIKPNKEQMDCIATMYEKSLVFYSDRLLTYKNWPLSKEQTPSELAEARFYYQGQDDEVICFQCGIGVNTWLSTDNVWLEHMKWSPSCVFLKMCREIVDVRNAWGDP